MQGMTTKTSGSAKVAPAKRRTYQSARRTEQAAQTRRDVLAAASELFASLGWAGTTMAAIASKANVAVETVYSGFGSKKALLRAAMESAVVGDDEPIPLAERPEWSRLGEGSLDDRMRAGMQLNADIQERSAGVWSAFLEAAASDAEVQAWKREMESNRRLDIGRAIERIVDREVDDSLLDLLWALLGPEVYTRLLEHRGWSRDDYERILADASLRIAMPEEAARRSS
jgi:AcrR family transcriptional regulator